MQLTYLYLLLVFTMERSKHEQGAQAQCALLCVRKFLDL